VGQELKAFSTHFGLHQEWRGRNSWEKNFISKDLEKGTEVTKIKIRQRLVGKWVTDQGWGGEKTYRAAG